MTRGIIFDVVLFLIAQSCIVFSALAMFAMIGEVNRKLPDSQQISYLFGHFAKTQRIFSEYRRLYPKGKLLMLTQALFGFGALSLVVLGWQLGIIG